MYLRMYFMLLTKCIFVHKEEETLMSKNAEKETRYIEFGQLLL